MAITAPGDAYGGNISRITKFWVPPIYATVVQMGTNEYFVQVALPVGLSCTST